MWCKNLSLEDWEEKATEEERGYLHGYCNKWVAENYQKGDEILVIAALDGDHQFEHLIHCCIVRDAMYVDVRGSTSRFESLLEGFEDECLDDYTNRFLYDTLEHFRSDMNKLGIKT